MSLDSRLVEIAAKIDVEVQAAVAAAAELVVKDAKHRVPVNTGALERAIHTEVEPQDGGVLVVAGGKDPQTGADAFYGHMVEHGTVRLPPQPFLIPALEQNRAAIEGMIVAAIRRAT